MTNPTWPRLSCPRPDPTTSMVARSIIQNLVESGLLHHHVDVDGNCWGDSQVGTCLFSGDTGGTHSPDHAIAESSQDGHNLRDTGSEAQS